MSEFQITDTPALESDIADTLATPVTGIPQSTAPPAGMLDVFGQSDWRDDHEKAMDTWRNESFTALDAAVIDPKSYGDERVPSGYTPDEWRKTRVVDDWMRLHTDGEAPPMGLSREFTRGRLAEQVFGGAGAENDDALYGEITKAATGRKQVKDLAAELSTAARTSATVGDLGEKGGTFKNWKAAAMNKPGYSAENEPDYFEAWHQTQRQAKDQLAPYKAELAQVWKAMKAGGAGSPSEVIKSLGADLLLGGGADGEDTVDEFQKKDAGAVAYEAYAKLAEDERPAFLDGLSVLIQQFPKEDRPALLATWGKQFGATVDSMGRGAVSRFTADGMQQWIDQEAANTAGPFAASEEFKAQGKVRTDESLKRRNFMDAVRKMERDEYAPTQFYSDPSKDVFSTRTLEQGFYGSASAVASVAVMATPYIGYATLGLAMEDFAFADLRDNAVRSGASEMDASRFAHENKTLAAVPQLGIEILQNNLALGKLPMANKVLMKLGDSIKNRLLRGVVKAGAVGAAETPVEEIQFLTPYLVQDISAALEADTGISAAEWSNGKDGALDGFWTRQATTFLSMLPLGAAAAAGGLNREARQAAFAKATDEELTAFGGTPEAIAGLRSAQGPASTAAAVDAFMETRDPNTEAAAAAVESQKQKVASQRQAVADLERLGYAAPTFTQTPEGVFVFDSDGNELGMAQNFAGASRIAAAHTTTLVNMEQDRVDALTSLMDGVKAAVALDPTSETEVNLGEFDPAQATPGMAARFAAQVALKEVAEGGTGKIARSVLGYSVTEMAQGVRHTVNRLFKGASITDAFHETGHGLRRKAHAAGTVTRAMEASLLINQDTVYAGRRVRDAQGKPKGTDLRLVPDGITAAMLETGEIPAAMIPAEFDGDGRRYADQILDEGVSEIIEAEVLKLRKGKGRGKLGITRELVQKNLQAMARLNATEAKSWKSFFAAVRGHWGLAMSRAVAMAGAERRGEFDPAVRDAYLDKLLGLDQQTEHDAGVQDEFSRMMAGFDDVDMEEDDIPFSIGRAADAKYLSLAQDPETNQERLTELVTAAMAAKGYSQDAAHKLMHQAPNASQASEDGTSGVVSLANLKNSELVPADYWTRPDWYLSSDTERESHSTIKRAMEGGKIRVYRTIPATAKDEKIRNGDWVTPSRAYAVESGNDENAPVKIISTVAKADQLFWDGNSADELGFDDGKNYAYKNTKNNRKLADLVTYEYDEDGNQSIIPLSKRFNYRDASPAFSIGRTDRPLFSATNVQDLRHDKTAWLDGDADTAGANDIVSKYYKTAAFAGIPKDSLLVAMPSTSGRNILPFALANRISKDFGQAIEQRPVGTATAKGEAKNKRTFFDKEADPVAFVPKAEVIADLQGKRVFITEDVHNTGESWIAFARMLMDNGVQVLGVATLVSTEQRITSPRDIERLSEKIAAATGKGIDEVLPAMHSLFDGTFKQLFNKAEAEVSRSNTRRNAENSAKLFDIASSGRRAGAYSNPLQSGDGSGGEVLGGDGLNQGTFGFSIGGAKAAGFEKAKAEGRTFTGKDGKERFELDASQAAFNPSAIKDPAHRNGFKRLGADSPIRWLVPEDMDTPLGNLISFDELFENYPQLAGLKVRLKTLPTGTQGRFARVEINGKVSLEFSNIDLTDRLKAGAALNVLLHETQHVIQDIEGFAQGGSPEQFQDYDEAGLKLENNKYAAAMRALIEEHEAKGGTAKDAMQSEYGKVLSDSLIKIQDALREPARKYRALPGEKEARGVQARQSMTAEARAATPFMDQWGSFSLGRAMPDIENLSPVANRVEAHRLYAEGKLLYGIDEQSEELSLITSMEMLNAYPPDALGYEQPDGPAFSLGGAKDAEYLALAQDPEKNRGKLQALVAMAAKAAGYLVEAWHGSPDFKGDAFNRKYFGRNTGLSRGGFSFTTDKAAAEGYMKGAVDQSQAMVDAANDVMREFQDRIDGGLEWTGPFDEESAPEFRSDMVDDIEDAAGYMLDLAKTMPSDLAGKLRAASKINSTDPTPRLIHVFLKNPTRIDVAGKELLQVQNPADAKSAEAITRDDSGKIIPLSQRFDSTKDSISFSLGPAQVAGILSDNALARITDPRRRTYVMSRIARDFNAMRLQIERITSLSGIRRSKGDLRREAMAREDLAAEEKIAAIHQRFGSLLADEDLVKIKSQPVHSFLSDPTTPLRGRVMSKRQAMKNHPDVFQLHRAGDYDGSDGVSRSVFGGQRMPDQAAQELFDEGLISEPTADAMWEALLTEQKTVAGMKEMLAKATDEIRAAKAEAKQEANEWLATQGKDQEVNFSDKEEIRRSLRMLDAILLALPAEIRGKIGGYTQISMIASDDARLAYLKDKLNKADKELEDFLRVEYAKEWEELLKKAAPKTNEAGQRPTGSIAADAYDVFRVAEHAMGMSFAEGEAEADKWDAIADHPDTDPKDVDLARVKAQMIRLTMNWPAADAARREQAVLEGDTIYFGGLRALAIENSRRRERLGKLRDSAVRGTGKTGHRMEREAAKQATATKLGAVKAMAWEFLSFGQVVNVLFGEKSDVARWMNSREIAASNGAHDGFQAKANALESLFDTLSGNRFDGEKLRHRMATDPTIKVQDVLGVDHTFTESQAITFLLMYRQEDGKRHLQGLMDDAGNVVSEWAWDDKSAATIEAGLSSEGRAAMAFLGSSYGEEYGRINDVFRRIWNVSMPRHKMYAPLSVKPVQGKGDTIMDPVSGDSMGAGMTPGSLKNRSFSAIAEPDFKDAFQVYLTHARQMEHFIAYAEFSRDALGIINRRETRNAIEAAGGADAAATLSKWVDYFALGGIHGAAMGGAWTKILGGMLGRLSQAALVGRVSVLCMQSLQLAAASFKMPTGAFLTRFAKLSAGRLQWGDTIQSEYIQRRLQQLPPVVRDMMAGMASGTPNRAKFLAGQAGRTIAGADALFTAGTYAIFYDYHLGLAKKAAIANPEAHAHAEAERFTDQVAQPVRTGARSWLEVANASNPAFRAAWNFSSDPRQKMSLLVYAAMRKDSTGTEKAADVAFTAAKLWIIGGVLSTLVRTVLRDLRNDDDDEIFDERYWSPARLALQVATGPIGGAPFLGDMVEGATYKATGQFMPTGGMLSFFDQAAGLPKKWAGGKVEPIKDLETLTSAGAGLSGTSAAAASAMHLIRDVVGFIENLEGPD